MNARKPISTVIPTYNGLSLLKKNLPSVIDCLSEGDELVIVDDASTDETASWLEKEVRPQLKKKNIDLAVVVNERNLRFGAAVNKGVKQATHALILLLNNDVSPQQGLIENLVPYFENTSVFAVGCMEREKNLGGKQGGKNKLWFEKGLFMHSRAVEFNAGQTGWASGGSAMFDKAKWLELGGFDKAYYPAYWEDIDLSFRAKKKGWLVLFEPHAVVDHNHESTNDDVFGQQRIAAMSWRNAHRFVWKNGTIWQKIANVLWRPYWFVKRLG